MQEYITDFDKLLASLDARPVSADVPVSERAGESTIRLFDYLRSIYGKKFISGQQYLQRGEIEDDVYFSETGKLPAIRGYDLMDMDKKKGDDQVRRAVQWAKSAGCIITMCWHWYAPDNMDDMENCDWSFYYKTTTYDHKTSFDLLKAVEYGTSEYRFAVSRIDKAAEALREFEKENIPVLFRPLHEANGDWFWWSLGGAENFRKLWQIMYDRYTNVYGLDNLIWVLGYSHLSISDYARGGKEIIYYPEEDWYPGDKYVDIAGADSYSGNAEKDRYDTLKKAITNKPLCFHECGTIPTVKMFKETPWVFFMTWHTEWLVYNDGNSQNDNTIDSLNEIYNDDYVITLDEIPSFRE